MCYSLLFSTTSDRDFSDFESEGFSLSRPTESDATPVQFLKNPHSWYVYSANEGCSCHFRYSMEDLRFITPEEYATTFNCEMEDEDDVLSTRLLFDFLQGLISSGEKVDLVAWWSSGDPSSFREQTVDLAEVGRERFRFFENTRFDLTG